MVIRQLVLQIMYSMLDGSEANCVTSVSTVDVSVTGIEVNPIHGYVDTSPYKHASLMFNCIDIYTGAYWDLVEGSFNWILYWLNLAIVLALLLV